MFTLQIKHSVYTATSDIIMLPVMYLHSEVSLGAYFQYNNYTYTAITCRCALPLSLYIKLLMDCNSPSLQAIIMDPLPCDDSIYEDVKVKSSHEEFNINENECYAKVTS